MALKVVIAGGPCTGKTTTINALKEDGFQIVPEIERNVIAEQIYCDGSLVPWGDIIGFQLEVMRRRVVIESKINAERTTFFDNALPTGIAYLQMGGLKVPEQLIEEGLIL